jgi:hypothetical protein
VGLFPSLAEKMFQMFRIALPRRSEPMLLHPFTLWWKHNQLLCGFFVLETPDNGQSQNLNDVAYLLDNFLITGWKFLLVRT